MKTVPHQAAVPRIIGFFSFALSTKKQLGAKIALVILTARGFTGTVVVTPESMHGWSVATTPGAIAELANYGPAVWERTNSWVADDRTDLGRGAFMAALDFGRSEPRTPPSVWLGLDTFNGKPLAGVALKRITSLEYYAYVAHIPTMTANPGHWDAWRLWYKFPRNPMTLQLTTESPDGKQRKQFWFTPWDAQKVKGDNCGRHAKKWLRYDCIRFNNPGPDMVGRWYTFGPPEEEFTSWTNLLTKYGEWKLVSTSDQAWPTGWKSTGWDEETEPAGAPTCTGTGKCLNFEVGARKAATDIFGERKLNWRNYYQGFKGHLDRFTLGIDGAEVTYDFEPSPAAETLPVLPLSNPEAWAFPERKLLPAQRYQLVEVTGQCTFRNAGVFKLDDGSGQIIEGILFKGTGGKTTDGENPAKIGEWWTVRGYLERLPFEPPDGPMCIWTAPGHMRKIPKPDKAVKP